VKQDGRNAYLSTMPSSWGAAYWSDKWNEFAEFVDVRIKQHPFGSNLNYV
jgi:hypothetical protein